MSAKPKKSNLPKNLELYRAKLACSIGRDALDGTNEKFQGQEAIRFALYNLLHAVSDIADHLDKEAGE